MIIEELDALKAITELLLNLWLGFIILFLFAIIIFIIKYTQLYDWCENLEQKIKLWAPENLDDLPKYDNYPLYIPAQTPPDNLPLYIDKENIRSVR